MNYPMQESRFFNYRALLTVFTLISSLRLAAQWPQNIPAPYSPGMQVNYIRTWDAAMPETNPNNITVSSDPRQFKMTTQYVDGLSRSLQTVVKKGSLETGTQAYADIVSATTYDEFGRERYNYLPFASTDATGTIKYNPFQQQVNFYNARLAGQLGETNIGPGNLNWAYNQKNFEISPLNRIQEGFASGTNWVGTYSQANEIDRHSVKIKYYSNTSADDIKKWTVTDVMNSWGVYSMTGVYPVGELYKTITVDEHGKQVIEFKDKEEQVILRKVQLTATADNGSGSDYMGWLCTYYIYDDLNNLRCVMQPEGVKTLAGTSWNLTPAILNEQCFRYEYDQRNRMILKKVPGAGEIYLVYDARDRLVMIQDANMRTATKWMVTKYDELNRPLETGLWINTTDVITHRSNASQSSSYPLTSGNYELLTVTHYDDYDNLPGGLTNNFDGSWAGYFNNTYNTSPLYAQQQTASQQTNGMITWIQVKVLGTSNTFLNTVNLYDEKGRVIQVKTTNITGGTDVTTVQYNWEGQPLITVAKTEKGNPNAQVSVVVTQMTYDDLGRVIKIEKKVSNTLVSGGMPDYRTIVENEYDKLGRLKKKKLAPAYNNNAGLETENFEYNIRGWLLGMNRDYAKDAGSNNYFGFDLGYDKANNNIIGGQVYTNPQFNGNIEGMVWKSKGDGEKRKYDFTYDGANRLTAADFNQYTGSSFNKTANVDFSVSDLTFDANGNILTMNQKGLKLNSSPMIDQLTYAYQINSNKLVKVTDAVSDPATKLGDFKDGTNGTTDDYGYDANGNLNLDNNKAISSITYNHLNLPSVITVTGKGTITYTYDAAGNKISKTVNETGQQSKITLYMAGSVFENDVLQFLGYEDGRIRALFDNAASPATITGFAYDYFVKDHLGNVRMVLTDEVKTNYYPAATLEGDVNNTTTAAGYENQFYSINAANIVDKTQATGISNYQNNNGIPNPYPAGNSGNTNVNANSQKLYKLAAGSSANTGVTGLGITLKVMSGDKINIFGKSYYFQNAAGSNNQSVPVTDIVNGIFGTPSSPAGSHGATATDVNNSSSLTGLISSFLSDPARGEGTVPKAYINWILFDESFKYVSGNFSRVGSNSVVKDHYGDAQLQNIPVIKNGYLYVYVSNESPVNVFFDNLQVVHTRGALLEETHYYPFGLTMAGISSKALNFGNPENKQKFIGKELQNREFSDASGLEWYDLAFRTHDPQIGRFLQIDPLANEYEYSTTYAYAENKVINGIDLEGLEWSPTYDNNSQINGYNWVGYNDNGSPKSGSVSHGLVVKGDFTWWYSSNQKRQTGAIDIMSNTKAPTQHGPFSDKSTIYNYRINIKQNDGALFLNTWSVYSNLWYNPGDPEDNHHVYDRAASGELNTINLFNDVKTQYGFGTPSTSINGLYPEQLWLIPVPKIGLASKLFTRLGEIEIPVYRVFGGLSGVFGESWTFINPRIYGRTFRFFGGVGEWNTGVGLVRGSVKLADINLLRAARPYGKLFGRLVPELVIKDSENKVILKSIRAWGF
jgi:RHS repeat-associated protein